MPRGRIHAIVTLGALAAIGPSCRSRQPSIDSVAVAALPPGATMLAGINLARVRASPLAKQLPPALAAFLESWHEADRVWIASDGANYLALIHGAAPAGATSIAPGLAAAGSSDWVRAAAERRPGAAASPLIERARPLAGTAEIWAVAAGNANLPLSGNGENFLQLLHMTDYTTLTLRLTDAAALELIGMCRGPETARHLEETLRAYLSLGAGAAKRQPALSDLLRQVRVSREDRAVHVTLNARVDQLQPLFRLF